MSFQPQLLSDKSLDEHAESDPFVVGPKNPTIIGCRSTRRVTPHRQLHASPELRLQLHFWERNPISVTRPRSSLGAAAIAPAVTGESNSSADWRFEELGMRSSWCGGDRGTASKASSRPTGRRRGQSENREGTGSSFRVLLRTALPVSIHRFVSFREACVTPYSPSC